MGCLSHNSVVLVTVVLVVVAINTNLATSSPIGDLKKRYPPPGDDLERQAARVAMQNPKYFGGDIIYSRKRSSRNAIKSDSSLWPNGIVPFVIDPRMESDRVRIYDAMNEYHSQTCIKFVRRTDEYDYIYITSLDGCYSYLGKVGGPQNVSLAPNCRYIGTIIHELGHAVGLIHEHQRYDRDKYLKVIFGNIIPGDLDQFEKMTDRQTRNLENYDYNSIMHYGSKSFSLDKNKMTMVPCTSNANGACTENNQVALHDPFERYGFADSDIRVLNKLYNCQPSSR